MKYFNSHLGLKLFLSYFLVIIIGMSSIWIATRFTAPRAFARHLFSMEQRMGMGNGMGQGQGQGAGQGGMMADFYDSFQATFNESLIIAVILASIVALVASLLFSKKIIEPVRIMTKASQRIAEGHYGERVLSAGSDELSQLAKSFNQMAEELEQVESMRRRLIGDVAHELRTPLTAIKGSAEGLVDGVLPASTETYQMIHSEADRLSRLVDDLQELSRVESRAVQLEIFPVDSTQLIQTVMKRMRFQFEDKHIALSSNLPQDPVQILADEGRAIQVLTNLLGNALLYTPEGGEVAISLERRDRMACISVRDTGIGISPGHLPRIFDRFYRADAARSRTRGGSGIGLTIARHLIESQGGKIWAESEGENKGSVFSFTLPCDV